ncbi:hypothetical protein [Streptomyces sp. NBC_01233]|uniref:hypothetical protein n=1 Tax=Streptomyces sp. NBC_01233 TaxID=2903787 RepID=UPI002E14954A|nr:hypothetical protein OG332_36790 [Streptomyces sp. NBC_01233]
MIASGDTLGIFQLESPGQRELVQNLRPRSFGDLQALTPHLRARRYSPAGTELGESPAGRFHAKMPTASDERPTRRPPASPTGEN